ncbi:MAG: hypothetical protein ACI4FZ_06530 [Lachnospiraceae bacterium]
MKFPFLTERRKLVKAIDLILSGDADMNDVNEFHNKQTFDQVGIQSDLLSQMRESHQNIDAVIGDISDNMSNIRDNTKNLLKYSEQVVETMSDNVHEVQQSTVKLEKINRDLQEFRQNIAASMDDTTHLLIEGNQKTENCLTEMEQMSELFQSNQALSGYCLALGKYMFKIGRYNDKTRSDLLRNVSSVST